MIKRLRNKQEDFFLLLQISFYIYQHIASSSILKLTDDNRKTIDRQSTIGQQSTVNREVEHLLMILKSVLYL